MNKFAPDSNFGSQSVATIHWSKTVNQVLQRKVIHAVFQESYKLGFARMSRMDAYDAYDASGSVA